jgi:hypothetical protein
MTDNSGKGVALFNGSVLSDWYPRDRAKENEWAVVGAVSLDTHDDTRFSAQPGQGVFYNGPAGKTSDLCTAQEHGDCRLHVEFVVPRGSNSGVYFMGRYEVQILDSWGATELKSGTCGGIYSRWINGQSVGGEPPRVNASKPPGQWQTYDIVFRAPRFDSAGNKTANATFVSVLWNGELVHENFEIDGPTRAAMFDHEATTGPLMLQGDHGPVAYRNVVMEMRVAE